MWHISLLIWLFTIAFLIFNISHGKLQYSLELGIKLFFFPFQMKPWTLSLFWEKWHRLVSPPTTSTLLQFKWRKWLTSSLGVTSVRTPSCKNPFQFFRRSQQGMVQSPEFCVTFFFFTVVVYFNKTLNCTWDLWLLESKTMLFCTSHQPYWSPCMLQHLLGTFCHVVVFVKLHSWLKNWNVLCGPSDR